MGGQRSLQVKVILNHIHMSGERVEQSLDLVRQWTSQLLISVPQLSSEICRLLILLVKLDTEDLIILTILGERYKL